MSNSNKRNFWILLMVSNILFAETNSTLCHSAAVFVFCFCDKFTCVSAAELVFLSLFSLLGWDIFISSVGFLLLSRIVCISASLPLCACQAFGISFQISQTKKYLYINKSRSCLKAVIVGKQPNFVPYDTSKHHFFPHSHSCITMRCVMVQCVCVNEGGRKWTCRGDETGFRPRGGSYTGASVLCVCRWDAPSKHLSERPQRDICPVTRVIQNSHTRTEIKIERSAPSSDWTNGHSVTLSEPLLDHFNHRIRGK